MKICIVANREKDKGLEISQKIKKLFEQKNILCDISEQTMINGTFHTCIDTLKSYDIIITIGGDGTLIQAARDARDIEVPLIGVNKGTLGYLTEINIENIYDMVEHISGGIYYTENRMMLSGNLERNGQTIFSNFALNDIVMYKNSFSNMMSMDVFVDEQLLTSYEADGLIVATPTGSTAYNLSAGGPLIVPSAAMMVLTPICAHVLTSRSVVIPAESTMKIIINDHRGNNNSGYMLVFDGAEKAEIFSGDVITITRDVKDTKLIRMSRTSFYKVLQKKLSI